MACTEVMEAKVTVTEVETMKATEAVVPQMSMMAIQAKKLPKRKIRKEDADAVEHKSRELVFGSFYVFHLSFVRFLRASCASKTPWHVVCS